MESAVAWAQDAAAYEPFAGLAAQTGLAVDQLNYVVCLLLAYPLSFIFRFISSPALRHFVSGFIGLLFGIFCFRFYVLHVFVLAGVTYLLIRIDSSAKNVHLTVSIFAVAYLTICHLYRQYYYFGLYILDITGPLMLLVQKLSCLAFSIHDAKHPAKDATEFQKKFAVHTAPSLLEYFGHVFFFPGFLAGPLHFFVDYKAFIEAKGLNYQGSVFAAVSKFLFAFVCLIINKLPGILGIDNDFKLLVDDLFVAQNSLAYRVVHLYFAAVCIRMQYYFAWILAEGANNLSGFGRGPKGAWDLISNVNVFGVELAPNLKMVLDNWNIQTQNWLRYVCYERTNSVFKTMFLSAIWHGLYPGYFLTFLTAALQTEAARKVRRVVRPKFHALGQPFIVLYDFLTWLTTCFILNYVVGPFVVLEFWGSVAFFSNFLFLGHIGAAVAMVALGGGKEGKGKGEKKDGKDGKEEKKTN